MCVIRNSLIMVNYYTQFLSTFKFHIEFVSLTGIDVTNLWEFARMHHFDMMHKNSLSQKKRWNLTSSRMELFWLGSIEVKSPRH